jgi:periplasmic protein TonB
MASTYSQDEQQERGISWARVLGNAFAIALHVFLFMALMVPMSAPDGNKVEEDSTVVSFIEPPPPEEKPKEIPKPKEEPKVIQKIIETPKPVQQPPPEQPPIVFNDPSPVDVAGPPPAPAAPPAPPADYGVTADISGNRLIPPIFPPAAKRECAFGTVMLLVTIDASGSVLSVDVQKSSRNRDLDRAAMETAKKKWKFNAGLRAGVAAGGSVLVPVEYANPCQ